MLLLIRHRYPRLANILSFITGLVTLAIGIACGASTTVLVIGGGSSVALSAVRYISKRHPRLLTGRAGAIAR